MKNFIAAFMLSLSFNSYAQEEINTSKTKQRELVTDQSEDQEDIDDEITNAKMRAEAGSKSKHSFSMDLTYNGGTIDNITAYRRPNIAGSAATSTLTSLSGEIGYRYRLSANDSITAGVGVEMLTPGYELAQEERNGGIKKYDASNPTIAFNRSFAGADLQNSISVSATAITSKEVIEAEKTRGLVGIDYVGLKDIGTSGWQIGVALWAYNYFYSEYTIDEEIEESSQTEYDIGFAPFVEYVFNDTYNFRTVYNGNSYTSTRDNRTAFSQGEITQSMGLGIAASRDIFLYPNIQWVWSDVRADKTNVALSATMNFL